MCARGLLLRVGLDGGTTSQIRVRTGTSITYDHEALPALCLHGMWSRYNLNIRLPMEGA